MLRYRTYIDGTHLTSLKDGFVGAGTYVVSKTATDAPFSDKTAYVLIYPSHVSNEWGAIAIDSDSGLKMAFGLFKSVGTTVWRTLSNV